MFNHYKFPLMLNIELTDMCPLNCPQCYCELNTGKQINYETLMNIIQQAQNSQIPFINLSGGETLMYPRLFEAIAACKKVDIKANIAISGWNFTNETYLNLIISGINGIFISLNGSTHNINSLSRNGYVYALNAMQILYENQFQNSFLNWVMQSNNTYDFPSLVILAEKYNIKNIVIMLKKPDINSDSIDMPTKTHIEFIANFINKYHGSIDIIVENCFSQLKAFLGRNIFYNNNSGLFRGCTAGIDSLAVDVYGRFIPCRHIKYSEEFFTLNDYWNYSRVLSSFRSSTNQSNHCLDCKLSNYCKPCVANFDYSMTPSPTTTYCPLQTE